ncbi:unnamed protein product [Lactuca virosa]|uniref:Importin N-terminal domain-containing protein n=1 Tax=Lactuca virosa TaxID=75947 RepID=A0AAU9MG62_9ASTR|nr:unnamed protein product [Lactuca virosa]
MESCRFAGTMLKNSLDATTREHLLQRWLTIDISFRCQIKGLILKTLGSSISEVGHTAAQVIAKIACIEIPRKEWPELLSSLLGNMTQQDQPASLKQATLESLGYICKEISHDDFVQDEVNSVLAAVLEGMNITEQSSVRLAAATALYKALQFTHTNFENEMERNNIMKVVCETARAKEADIRKAAFQCLVFIASTYYKFLEPYMATLFELTANAIDVDEESIAFQAVEFWSCICEEEIKLQDIENRANSRFIEKCMDVLVRMLLETLLKQDEDGIWNLSVAGGRCLGLVARIVGDSIVRFVLPIAVDNLSECDWRSREAGAYALGSILEGPSAEHLSPHLLCFLYLLLDAMEDQNSHVKDTTAWTLTRTFKLLHSTATGFSKISPADLERTIWVLLESIKDSPRIAEKVCGAIYYLAHGYEGFKSRSSVLTPYLADIITSLIATAERTDTKLQSAAYETLNEVVRCSNLPEASQIITQLLSVVMTKLGQGQTTEPQILSSYDRENQALLCGVLQVIIKKLSSTDETKTSIFQAADQIMALLLKDLSTGDLHPSLKPPIFSCFGDVALVIREHFEKYFPDAMSMMHGAVDACAQINDEEMVEYGNQLKRSIFEAYSGILQGLKNSKAELMLPRAPHLLKLIEVVVKDPHRDKRVVRAAVAALGDLADSLGSHSHMKVLFKDIEFFSELLGECRQYEDEQLKETAIWTQGMIDRVCGFGFGSSITRVGYITIVSPPTFPYSSIFSLQNTKNLHLTFFYPLLSPPATTASPTRGHRRSPRNNLPRLWKSVDPRCSIG